MFLYILAMNTRCSTAQVTAALADALGVANLAVASGRYPALRVFVDDQFDSSRQSANAGFLGFPATVEVTYLYDVKTDWNEVDRAKTAIASSAVLLVSRVDALAYLMFEDGGMAMRRTNGTLYLYDWFTTWREPQVQAVLPQPWVLTSDEKAGIPPWVPEPATGVRERWVPPLAAPRPPVPGGVHYLDLTQPTAQAAPGPGALYRATLPGDVAADYYTDAGAQICYVETVPGVPGHPNSVLDAPQPGVTYVVHPAEPRRQAHLLRTDAQRRVVEVATERLVHGPGRGGHPMADLFGGGTERVSATALFATTTGPASRSLASLATRLGQAVDQGRTVGVQITAAYEGASVVPTGFQVDCTIDGAPYAESFDNGEKTPPTRI